ncbi:hypothetical protein PPTG_23874 [Phytophthora nicotianae INRA-310]|uniref:Uncharacterized protein n=1 Tax=Phytophthora nicotianae (strain INRA-310) TaxID=761204 RepID=W2PQ11_PHYN3|nr:hypothetical protein PPTG_23874 [Phytophthora nicotianae INRA-310]ETN02716.1 hypothetical protein PPTG_23874 [Phytophthora nicotianae INRA-310]
MAMREDEVNASGKDTTAMEPEVVRNVCVGLEDEDLGVIAYCKTEFIHNQIMMTELSQSNGELGMRTRYLEKAVRSSITATAT